MHKIIAEEKEEVLAKVKTSGKCILTCQTVWGIRQDNLQFNWLKGGVVNQVGWIGAFQA
jgi:hypothetical protein